MSDRLPEDLEQVTISAMMEGEIGYTHAWAIYVEPDGTSWIRGDYAVYPEPIADANLRIEKRSDRVAVHKETVGEHKYDRREKPMAEWEPIQVEWILGAA